MLTRKYDKINSAVNEAKNSNYLSNENIACISDTEEGNGSVLAIRLSGDRTTIDVSRKEGLLEVLFIAVKFLFLL